MIGKSSCDGRIKGIRVASALGKSLLRTLIWRTSRRPRLRSFASWTTQLIKSASAERSKKVKTSG